MVNSIKINVSVGILLRDNREVLIARRADDVPLPGLWEFPGGKVEPSEDSYSALCRELKEEIAIDVLDAKPLMIVSHQYEDYSVDLHVWRVSQYRGEPSSAEGQPLQWISIDRLSEFPLPGANAEIVNRLKREIQYQPA